MAEGSPYATHSRGPILWNHAGYHGSLANRSGLRGTLVTLASTQFPSSWNGAGTLVARCVARCVTRCVVRGVVTWHTSGSMRGTMRDKVRGTLRGTLRSRTSWFTRARSKRRSKDAWSRTLNLITGCDSGNWCCSCAHSTCGVVRRQQRRLEPYVN